MASSNVYTVQELLKKRVVNGKVEYLVLWEGYPRSQATWEPDAHIVDRNLVKELEKKTNKKRRSGARPRSASKRPKETPTPSRRKRSMNSRSSTPSGSRPKRTKPETPAAAPSAQRNRTSKRDEAGRTISTSEVAEMLMEDSDVDDDNGGAVLAPAAVVMPRRTGASSSSSAVPPSTPNVRRRTVLSPPPRRLSTLQSSSSSRVAPPSAATPRRNTSPPGDRANSAAQPIVAQPVVQPVAQPVAAVPWGVFVLPALLLLGAMVALITADHVVVERKGLLFFVARIIYYACATGALLFLLTHRLAQLMQCDDGSVLGVGRSVVRTGVAVALLSMFACGNASALGGAALLCGRGIAETLLRGPGGLPDSRWIALLADVLGLTAILYTTTALTSETVLLYRTAAELTLALTTLTDGTEGPLAWVLALAQRVAPVAVIGAAAVLSIQALQASADILPAAAPVLYTVTSAVCVALEAYEGARRPVK